MTRRFGLGLVLVLASAALVRADQFDRYINTVLEKVAQSGVALEVKRLSAAQISEHAKVLPDAAGALIVVKTNNGYLGKALVQVARHRVGQSTVPIILIERFVTYRPTTERAVLVSGQSVHLYDGFTFNFEVGQIVPETVGGDIRFTAEGDRGFLEAVGTAKLYLLTKPMPGLEAKKGERPQPGDMFEPAFFNGSYALHDDGRRTARLILKVDGEGQVTGEYVSEMTGQKYELTGKVGNPKNSIQFTVKFPQSQQSFQGWLFTRDAAALCGYSKLQDREFGFYALRVDD